MTQTKVKVLLVEDDLVLGYVVRDYLHSPKTSFCDAEFTGVFGALTLISVQLLTRRICFGRVE